MNIHNRGTEHHSYGYFFVSIFFRCFMSIFSQRRMPCLYVLVAVGLKSQLLSIVSAFNLFISENFMIFALLKNV